MVSRDYFIHPARMYGLAMLKLLDTLVPRYYQGTGRVAALSQFDNDIFFARGIFMSPLYPCTLSSESPPLLRSPVIPGQRAGYSCLNRMYGVGSRLFTSIMYK